MEVIPVGSSNRAKVAGTPATMAPEAEFDTS